MISRCPSVFSFFQKIRVCCFGAGMIFCVSAAGSAHAALKLHPGLSLFEEYNDNLFLESANEDSDFITTLHPNIRAEMDSSQLRLMADYGLKFLFYKEHSNRDEQDFKDIQRASISATVFPEGDFTVGITETITRETVDQRDASVAENDFLNKTTVNRFTVNPKYRSLAFKTFEPTLGYRYEQVAYDTDTGDDYLRHTFSLEFAKRLFADRLRVVLDASTAFHEANISSDYKRDEVYGALFFKATSQLTLAARAGKSLFDFDGLENMRGNGGKIGGEYVFSSRLKSSVYYSEIFVSSVTSGLLKRKNATAEVVFHDFFTTSLKVMGNRDLYLEASREDRSIESSLVFGIPLSEKINLSISGGYDYLKYLPLMETARRYTVGTAIQWVFNDLDVTLSYIWRSRDSTFVGRDYDINLIRLGVGWRF